MHIIGRASGILFRVLVKPSIRVQEPIMIETEERIEAYIRGFYWHWLWASVPVIPVFVIGSNSGLAICSISLVGALLLLDARLYAIAQRLKMNNDLLLENAKSMRT